MAYFMAGEEERDQFIMVMMLGSAAWLHSAFFAYQDWINNGKKLSWLNLLKSCSFESFDFKRIGLNSVGASRFRQRVWLTTRLSGIYLFNFGVICFVFGMFIVIFNFPPDYRLTFGIFHAVNFTFFCVAVLAACYGMVFVFNQVTFYFVLSTGSCQTIAFKV